MAETDQEKFKGAWPKIVAKAWADADFKARLKASPAEVLKEYGVSTPSSVTLKVVENSKDVVHLTVPPSPEGELSETDLARAWGGHGCCSAGPCRSCWAYSSGSSFPYRARSRLACFSGLS